MLATFCYDHCNYLGVRLGLVWVYSMFGVYKQCVRSNSTNLLKEHYVGDSVHPVTGFTTVNLVHYEPVYIVYVPHSLTKYVAIGCPRTLPGSLCKISKLG